MKIAILGSAPSSLSLAPIGDQSWKIWGCSPGVYSMARRCNAWFELHRWEPPTIGVPESQKQWFSPEYVQWMAMRNPTPPRNPGDPDDCPVWMYEKVPEIPASQALPIDDLKAKYGTYFFTSSISIMIACAIEDITEDRERRVAAGYPVAEGQDSIGLWGVDMAATEEYGYQRAGCQHFLLLAADLGINIVVPPESDLLRPMPIYGISESSHWMIKNTVRKREIEGRLAQAQASVQAAMQNVHFLQGAKDDLDYQMTTWGEDRDGVGVSPLVVIQSPRLRAALDEINAPIHAAALQEANRRTAEATALLAQAHETLERLPPKLRAELEKGNTLDEVKPGEVKGFLPKKKAGKAKRKR